MIQKKSYNFFFILGRGRSGTSLLRSLLNEHPQLFVPRECFFMMNLYSAYKNVKDWTPKKRLAYYNDIWTDSRININWSFDKKLLKKDILESPDQDFVGLSKLVYIHHLRNVGKDSTELIGDKNPIHSLFTNELSELFKNSKFIYLSRDHRDNILSFKNVKFDFNHPAILAQRWKSYNSNILSVYERHGSNFLWVKYEDLISSPETSLREICDFLGVGYSGKMMEFYKRKEITRSWHVNLNQPIDAKNLNKWENEMSPKDLTIANYICASTAGKLGYETKRASFPMKYLFHYLLGVIIGKLSVWLEKLIFYIPLWIRSKTIPFYRKKTGSLKNV